MSHNWQELLPFYVAGTLSVEQRNVLETHLKTCPDCRARLKEWQMIAKGTRAEARGRGEQPPAFDLVRIKSAKLPQGGLAPVSVPTPPKLAQRPITDTPVLSRILGLAAAFIILGFAAIVLFQQTLNSPVYGGSTEFAQLTPGTTLTPGLGKATEDIQSASASLPAPSELPVLPATRPTETIVPTSTAILIATATQEPTLTPVPTNTPIPPTSTPRPTNLPPTTMPVVPTRRASPVPPTSVPPNPGVPTNVVVPTVRNPPVPTNRGRP